MRWFRMPSILTLFLAVFLLLAHPMPSTASAAPLLFEVQSLFTSYYSPKLEGNRTANGQRYDSEGLMAAHRTLPFGTVLRVTNLRNGRDVLVRVNDRGPFSPRLGLDLSQAAAREINMIRAGVVKVQVEIVGDTKGRPLLAGHKFYVDMGTVSGPQSEARLFLQVNEAVGKAGKQAPVAVHTKVLPDNYGRRFVGLGPFKNFLEAEQHFKALKPHMPRARVICAPVETTAGMTAGMTVSTQNSIQPGVGDKPVGKPRLKLVSSVVADDIPKVILDYKGKPQKSKKAVQSKKLRKNKKNTAPSKVSKASKAASPSKSSEKSGAKITGSVKKSTPQTPAPPKTPAKTKTSTKTSSTLKGSTS